MIARKSGRMGFAVSYLFQAKGYCPIILIDFGLTLGCLVNFGSTRLRFTFGHTLTLSCFWNNVESNHLQRELLPLFTCRLIPYPGYTLPGNVDKNCRIMLQTAFILNLHVGLGKHS